jgi:hypothetical protein
MRHWKACLLMVVCLLVSACGSAQGAGSSDPPLPEGWSWYHDVRFPYQAPIPPGWQTVAFNDWTYGTPRDCVRKAFFLPPGSHTEAEFLSPAPRVPEYISIETMVDCPERTASDNPNYQPLHDSLVIGGAPADFYGYGPDGYGLHRLAVAHFGGHQYLMTFVYEYESTISPAQRQQHDLDWYMQVLRGFKYTGT